LGCKILDTRYITAISTEWEITTNMNVIRNKHVTLSVYYITEILQLHICVCWVVYNDFTSLKYRSYMKQRL